MQLPLKDLLILEFGQNLSAPLTGLRLADMGARVIKVELTRNGSGPLNQSAANFLHNQALNRNKESVLINTDLKSGRMLLQNLVKKAQVLLHNHPNNYMEAFGLDYQSAQQINPTLIYGCISGYGTNTPWKQLPDVDSLLQSLSGLAFTTGNYTDHPMPFGAAIADKLSSAQLVQGIMAAMIRRQKTGKGALVEISLLESLLDFQFELLTTYYSCGQVPVRSNINNGHSLLSAPYGIYATSNGFIAIAMVDLQKLGKAIACTELMHFTTGDAFIKRDEIKVILSEHLKQKPTDFWLKQMHKEDLWTMEVLSWQQLVQHPAYKCLQMEQQLDFDGQSVVTTRSPIRFGGQKIYSNKPAPFVGEHTELIANQFA
jgi:crotonobetainyl-CoA:carnitine CoA-transferase CaiB-like acyl-CoA transferase